MAQASTGAKLFSVASAVIGAIATAGFIAIGNFPAAAVVGVMATMLSINAIQDSKAHYEDVEYLMNETGISDAKSRQIIDKLEKSIENRVHCMD